MTLAGDGPDSIDYSPDIIPKEQGTSRLFITSVTCAYFLYVIESLFSMSHVTLKQYSFFSLSLM